MSRDQPTKRAHLDIRVDVVSLRVAAFAAQRNQQTLADFARAKLWDGIRECMSEEEIQELGGSDAA